MLEFARLRRGLVLVTGITGSGKSTSLAALIDYINSTRHEHIMTVEDPIEFLHNHKKSVVNQREVGTDTHSFAEALKRVLRQDPDVILVGEMRDLETISTALTAAETGHLVFGTLHTQDAPQSVDRVIDVFPPHQQQQIRVQLASSIAGVVSQQLVPLASRKGQRRRRRDPGRDSRGEKPHPRGKDAPDLHLDAGGREVRDAGHGPAPRRARQERQGRATRWLSSAATKSRSSTAWSERDREMAATSFAYKVRTKEGRVLEGKMDATGEGAVASRLRQQGMTPIQITKDKKASMKMEIRIQPSEGQAQGPRDLLPPVRDDDQLRGCRCCARLNILAEQTENPTLAKTIGHLRDDVERGSSLSASMSKYPKVFSKLFVSMVKAGETGGQLDIVLNRVADGLEADYKLRQKVKSAMTYPVVVAGIAGVPGDRHAAVRGADVRRACSTASAASCRCRPRSC